MRKIDEERFRKTLINKIEFYKERCFSAELMVAEDLLWHFDLLVKHSDFMNRDLDEEYKLNKGETA